MFIGKGNLGGNFSSFLQKNLQVESLLAESLERQAKAVEKANEGNDVSASSRLKGKRQISPSFF